MSLQAFNNQEKLEMDPLTYDDDKTLTSRYKTHETNDERAITGKPKDLHLTNNDNTCKEDRHIDDRHMQEKKTHDQVQRQPEAGNRV
jgi:hypothetical protein